MGAATGGAGPLDGLRVLDLSTSMAGFQAGQVLTDFGAETVHVEPPVGARSERCRRTRSSPVAARAWCSISSGRTARPPRSNSLPAPTC